MRRRGPRPRRAVLRPGRACGKGCTGDVFPERPARGRQLRNCAVIATRCRGHTSTAFEPAISKRCEQRCRAQAIRVRNRGNRAGGQVAARAIVRVRQRSFAVRRPPLWRESMIVLYVHSNIENRGWKPVMGASSGLRSVKDMGRSEALRGLPDGNVHDLSRVRSRAVSRSRDAHPGPGCHPAGSKAGACSWRSIPTWPTRPGITPVVATAEHA